MLANKEEIHGLFIQNANFVKTVNLIYKFLNQNLLSTLKPDAKSVATLFTNLELLRHPDASEDSLIYRLHSYIEKINKEAEHIISIKDSFERWMNILCIATKSDDAEFLFRESKKEQLEEFENLLINKGLFEIERVLWDIKDPSLTNEIMTSLKQSLGIEKKINIAEFLDTIEQIKDDLQGIVNAGVKLKKNIRDQQNQQKKIEILLTEYRNFIKDGFRNIFKRIFTPQQISTKITNSTEIFKRTLRNIEMRKRFKLRANKKIKKHKNVEKTKAPKSQLYSMLHSHSPIENLDIPTIIANNAHIKNEAKRLHLTGMKLSEACDKSVIDNPNLNKFRSMVTMKSKKEIAL